MVQKGNGLVVNTDKNSGVGEFYMGMFDGGARNAVVV